jgi:hypothetical protein
MNGSTDHPSPHINVAAHHEAAGIPASSLDVTLNQEGYPR